MGELKKHNLYPNTFDLPKKLKRERVHGKLLGIRMGKTASTFDYMESMENDVEWPDE